MSCAVRVPPPSIIKLPTWQNWWISTHELILLYNGPGGGIKVGVVNQEGFAGSDSCHGVAYNDIIRAVLIELSHKCLQGAVVLHIRIFDFERHTLGIKPRGVMVSERNF